MKIKTERVEDQCGKRGSGVSYWEQWTKGSMEDDDQRMMDGSCGRTPRSPMEHVKAKAENRKSVAVFSIVTLHHLALSPCGH